MNVFVCKLHEARVTDEINKTSSQIAPPDASECECANFCLQAIDFTQLDTLS